MTVAGLAIGVDTGTKLRGPANAARCARDWNASVRRSLVRAHLTS